MEQETKEANPQHILNMLTAMFIARCLAVAAELRIADILATGAKSSEEVARKIGVDPGSLLRVLRALQSADVFAQDAQGRFRAYTVG